MLGCMITIFNLPNSYVDIYVMNTDVPGANKGKNLDVLRLDPAPRIGACDDIEV